MTTHQRNRTVIIFAVAAFLLLAGFVLFPALRADAAEDGKAAPSWTLNTVDGKAVSSDAFKGKAVVIDFWATWCPPCRREIPAYIEMQKELGGKGLAIVGISLDSNGPGVVKEFMEKYGMNYTVVMGDDAVADAFGGIPAIPTTFVIGRDGRIAYSKVGYEPHDEFLEHIKPLL